jgi:hypothetical protein
METFLGMEVEQPGKIIRLRHDTYFQEVLDSGLSTRSISQKHLVQSVFRYLTASSSAMRIATVPDPRKLKYYPAFFTKLQFAASWIRFETSFTVSSLARFCASTGPSHWAALHHLMEYIEGFPSLKLNYRRRNGVDDGLSGFADSDWGNSSSRRRGSTSGNLCIYNRCSIPWRSKMQQTMALSTAEAEYYSVSTAATEGL